MLNVSEHATPIGRRVIERIFVVFEALRQSTKARSQISQTEGVNTMASRDEVRADMYVRLYNDNRTQLIKAGDAWEEPLLSFYYATENQVDIAMKLVMIAVLKADGTKLPNSKWAELSVSINLNTVVSEAIDTITNLSLFAT